MTSMFDIQIVDRDFNLESTMSDNIALKQKNKTLSVALGFAFVAIIAIGILLVQNTTKIHDEKTQ